MTLRREYKLGQVVKIVDPTDRREGLLIDATIVARKKAQYDFLGKEYQEMAEGATAKGYEYNSLEDEIDHSRRHDVLFIEFSKEIVLYKRDPVSRSRVEAGKKIVKHLQTIREDDIIIPLDELTANFCEIKEE